MKKTAAEEHYSFVRYERKGVAIFRDNGTGRFERFMANKGHASWGFRWNNTDWEFMSSNDIHDNNQAMSDCLFDALRKGPINCTAYMIACYIRDGQLKHARGLYFNDGDKISSYKEYQTEIESVIGCRLHGKIGCQNPLCVR